MFCASLQAGVVDMMPRQGAHKAAGARCSRHALSASMLFEVPCSHSGLLRRRRRILGWSKPRLFEVRSGYLVCYAGSSAASRAKVVDLHGCCVPPMSKKELEKARLGKGAAGFGLSLQSGSGATLMRLVAPTEESRDTWARLLSSVRRRTLKDFRHVATLGTGAFGHVTLVEEAARVSTSATPPPCGSCKRGDTAAGVPSDRVCSADDATAPAEGGKTAGTAVSPCPTAPLGVQPKRYALKVISLERVGEQSSTPAEQAAEERKVLQIAGSHPFVTRLHYAFLDRGKLHFVQSACLGGDLYHNLMAQEKRRFAEPVVRLIAAELLLAIGHLHQRKLLHRDIKLENVLLDAEGHVKLADFGHAKHLKERSRSDSIVGTDRYCPPEMLNGLAHGRAVDFWQLGCLVFELLTGYPPFFQSDKGARRQAILKGRVRFPSFVSVRAGHLVTSLLQVNTWERLGAGDGDIAEVQRHAFFEGLEWDAVLRKDVTPGYVPAAVVLKEESNGTTAAGASGASGASAEFDAETAFLGFDYCWETDEVYCSDRLRM